MKYVFDVLPTLKDGDSNFLRAKSCPEAEDILGRIHVPVVEDTTLRSLPAPYSQPIDALRPDKRAARRTGSGGVGFANDLEDDACVSAFIFQHRFQL